MTRLPFPRLPGRFRRPSRPARGEGRPIGKGDLREKKSL